MKNLIPLLLLAPLAAYAADAQPQFSGRIERLDPAFDQLVATDAKVEKVTEGFVWSEGPLWFNNSLIFSDVPENIIYQWKPGTTKAEVFIKPSGMLTEVPGFREKGSNGLAKDTQGRLLVAQHGERRIARWEAGKFTAIADKFEGKRFNSPNDMAVRKSGDIYFTDPPYGLEGIDNSPLKELAHHGIYRVTPAGVVTLLSKDVRYPNGIAFSPDEKTLYIGSTDNRTPRLVAFDVKDDGTLANERTLFDAAPHQRTGPGGCDGLKVDAAGNIWTSAPGGVYVVSPTGKLLAKILTGQHTSNVAWGEDGSTLYITADMFVVRVKTKTKGAGW